MKEEALLIASRLDTVRVLNNSKAQESVLNQAQTMIRRLVEELDKKSTPVNHYEPTAWINHIKQTGGDFYKSLKS